jgi:hypothetical protein
MVYIRERLKCIRRNGEETYILQKAGVIGVPVFVTKYPEINWKILIVKSVEKIWNVHNIKVGKGRMLSLPD